MVWEQSLSGLIKALRASKNDETRVVRTALSEIAREAKSPDWEIKAGAVLKLTYLEMLGHSHLAQYSFTVVECMSSPRFHIKQIGYLAASQSFAEGNEVILLTNNLIKKDLSTPSPLPTSLLLTITSLPPLLVSSSQLSTDLHPEMIRQLSHSRPQVRKAAVLVLGSLWSTSPSAATLPVSQESIVDKLAEKLLDDDPSVVGATVNVMLEMARACKNEEDRVPFLRLAPECFDLLTSSTNNWTLIKLIKLFALLTPVEPRLVRKLLPPLTSLITTTPAMSLLYECIHAVIAGGMLVDNEPLAKTCVTKLATFLQDSDQNLRYISLLALNKLLPTHPHLITSHSATILTLIDDPDVSIRSRALDLLEGMIDRSNLQIVVKKLLSHLTNAPKSTAVEALSSIASGSSATTVSANPSILTPAYKATLIRLILKMCTASTYSNISNFHWFIDLLSTLAKTASFLSNMELESEVGKVLIDVSARAKGVRPYAVTTCIGLLPEGVMPEACAWVVGEYCADQSEWRRAIQALTNAGQLYAAVKVFARWCAALEESGQWRDSASLAEVRRWAEDLRDSEPIEHMFELPLLMRAVVVNLAAPTQPEQKAPTPSHADEDNPFAEQQQPEEEESYDSAPFGLSLLPPLFFAHELNPVNEKAQSLVAVPDGLDLDSWVSPGSIPSMQSFASAADEQVDEFGRPKGGFGHVSELELNGYGMKPKKSKKDKVLLEDGKPKKKKKKDKHRAVSDDQDIDDIPIVKIDLGSIKPSPSRRATEEATPVERPPTPPQIFIDTEGELPQGTHLRKQDAASKDASRVPTPQSATPEPDQTPAQPAAEEGVEVKVVKIGSKKKKKKKDKAGEA